MHAKPDLEVKIVLLGDQAVGKTSLIQTYVDREFTECELPTIFDNKVTHSKFLDKIVKLSLWDTGGNSEYDRLRPLSYQRADIFMICFAIDQPQTFRHAITKWSDQIQKYNPSALRLYVCTKMDKVSHELDKINFSQKPCLPFFIVQQRIAGLGYQLASCSSKCFQGVEETFNLAIKLVASKIYGKQLSTKDSSGCPIF